MTEQKEPENNQPTNLENPETETATGSIAVVSNPNTPEEKTHGKFKRFWTKYKTNKKLSIPLTIFILVVLILTIPLTRYKALGLFIKKNFVITVLDNSTQKPVTNAQATLAGVSGTTDNNGKVILHAKVGKATLEITKNYYQNFNQSVMVGLSTTKNNLGISITATGRQAPVTVKNKITGKPIENAKITAAGAEVITDKDGAATIVVPVGADAQAAVISGNGFNDTKTTLKVTEDKVKANDFTLTPAGKIYFLSKASGKIDVVKTNLDGTDRQTVLAGTGNESEDNTILMASKDWKYLALYSKRSGKLPKLYLIDTSNGSLINMDEGNASFELTGWQGHNFIYAVKWRNNLELWQPKRNALKSYNADSRQINLLYETTAYGSNDSNYLSEELGNIHVLSNAVLFDIYWDLGSEASSNKIKNNKVSMFSISANGSNKVALKTIKLNGNDLYTYLESQAIKPEDVIYRANIEDLTGNPNEYFFKYENGVISKSDTLKSEDFYDKLYPTYLTSPNGQETFWSDSRDGGNTLLVGDANGDNSKAVAKLSEMDAYGWFTDEYLLVSKDQSQLYIMPRAGGKQLKISNYHRPENPYYGGM